jgi:hypothetical protein
VKEGSVPRGAREIDVCLIRQQKVEHVWSRAGATHRKPRQGRAPRKWLKRNEARPSAARGNLPSLEGVDGSSPSVGSSKALHVGAFAFRRTCSASNMQWTSRARSSWPARAARGARRRLERSLPAVRTCRRTRRERSGGDIRLRSGLRRLRALTAQTTFVPGPPPPGVDEARNEARSVDRPVAPCQRFTSRSREGGVWSRDQVSLLCPIRPPRGPKAPLFRA